MQSVGNNYVLVYGIIDHLLAKPLQKEVNAFKPAITKPMNTWVEHDRPPASTINVDVERVNFSAVKILIKWTQCCNGLVRKFCIRVQFNNCLLL